MADLKQLTDLEYSFEFFGYSPSSVREDFERKIASVFNSNVKILQKKLSSKCQTDLQKDNLQKCFQHFREAFQKNSMKHLEEFHSLATELFKILPHVLFKEDEVYRNMSDNSNDIDAEIKLLENEFKKTQLLKMLAQSKLKILKDVESSMLDVGDCKERLEKLNRISQTHEEMCTFLTSTFNQTQDQS